MPLGTGLGTNRIRSGTDGPCGQSAGAQPPAAQCAPSGSGTACAGSPGLRRFPSAARPRRETRQWTTVRPAGALSSIPGKRRVSASVSYCWSMAVCLAGKVPAQSMTCRRAGRTPRWWGILNSNKATASAIANHWGGASPWAPGCGQKPWASRLPPRMMPVKTCSDVRKCSFKSRMTRAVLGCRL